MSEMWAIPAFMILTVYHDKLKKTYLISVRRIDGHGGNDMEISTVITALNSVGERSEPCGEPVVSGCG